MKFARALPMLAIAALLGCGMVPGGGTPAPQKARAGQAPGGDFTPFAELTEGTTTAEGYLDMYKEPGHLYMAVPDARLGEHFLMSFEIARGIGARGLFGGTMLDIFAGNVVSLERHGDKVYLMQHPVRFMATDAPAVENAIDLTFGPSVLASADIESVREDSALVIDIYDWIVSDLSNVSARVRRAARGRANLDRSRSFLKDVEAFPDNVNITAKLTFQPGEPVSIGSVADDRYIPVSIHYTMARLPEAPMTPRMADDRVGYFMSVRKDFAADDTTFFVRYVNRWRLEPKPGAEPGPDGLIEPKEPIVYYLDRTIPKEYRPYIAAAVEEWNRAFEAAGWKNAIQAKPLPEGASAEDIRYATIRWNTSNQPGYGAIGPSIVDPRTGEVLDADVLIEASMVLGWKNQWRTMMRPSAAVKNMLYATPAELRRAAAGGEMAMLGAELSAQGVLVRASLIAAGRIGADEPVPMEYIGEVLKWVTMHEVGHTLGLRHNFRSSADTPLEMLDNGEWIEEHGLYSSVMEYPTVNLAPDGGSVPYYYTPTVGTYDRWAISYGYARDPERAEQIARQVAQPGHAYGTDGDARGAGALDPTVNVYDLSADPLAWGMGRAGRIADLWPSLPENILTDNARFAELTGAFQTLLGQYARALVTGVKYIGGQYQYRDHVGDPDGRPPFVAVSGDRQREALAFLEEYAFGEDAFAVPSDVLARLGANRWSHWGMRNTFSGRIDYPFHRQVAGIQAALLGAITEPYVFARILDAQRKFPDADLLSIPEVMRAITRSVWSEVWSGGARDIGAMRRDLQRSYLERMTEILVAPSERMPADARAVARYELRELERRIERRLTNRGALDTYTEAHLIEARARIRKALEAGLEIEFAG